MAPLADRLQTLELLNPQTESLWNTITASLSKMGEMCSEKEAANATLLQQEVDKAKGMAPADPEAAERQVQEAMDELDAAFDVDANPAASGGDSTDSGDIVGRNNAAAKWLAKLAAANGERAEAKRLLANTVVTAQRRIGKASGVIKKHS